MLAGLTLAVLVFLFLVYLPGMAALAVAGRSKSERDWASAVSIGAMIFVCTLLFAWLAGQFSVWAGEMISGVVETLLAASGYAGAEMHLGAVLLAFSIEYLAAIGLGLTELFLVLKGNPLAWKRRKGPALSAGSVLLELLVRYRRARVRPRIIIRFADGREPARGECLRYSWNGRETGLLRDFDDLNKVFWVDLAGAEEIEFDNWDFLQDAEVRRVGLGKTLEMVGAYRKVLNWVAPGLGDEAYASERLPAELRAEVSRQKQK